MIFWKVGNVIIETIVKWYFTILNFANLQWCVVFRYYKSVNIMITEKLSNFYGNYDNFSEYFKKVVVILENTGNTIVIFIWSSTKNNWQFIFYVMLHWFNTIKRCEIFIPFVLQMGWLKHCEELLIFQVFLL